MLKKLKYTYIIPLLFSNIAYADDSLSNKPPPSSADQLESQFDAGMAAEPEIDTSLDKLLENSRLKLKLRNYYFNRAKPTSIDSIAWAQGGSLEYKLGKIDNAFSFNSEIYGSYGLYAPQEHPGTLLLQPIQDDITVVGIFNPKVYLGKSVISVYRQRYDLPFLNAQENRMIPNTFEGYTIAMTKAENKTFQYIAGYIDRIKPRDSDTFISLSDAAGVTNIERGVFVSGGRYSPISDLTISAIDEYSEDIINNFYSELTYKHKYKDEIADTISAQFGTQDSVGDNLIRGDDYSVGIWGVQNAVSFKNFILKAAYTSVDKGADFNSPWGSYAGYNSSIVQDFNRAGEQAWSLGLSYDFKDLGLNGVTLSSAYISGDSAVDEITKAKLADIEEVDATLDYRISDGILKGFWFRARSANIEEAGQGTTKDYRIIVNYDITLWDPTAENT